MIELSVVLPCYREANNLAFLLPQLRQTLDALSLSYEVLVVDTPEPLDDTPRIASEQGAVYLPRRGGYRYGDAYRTGIEAAQGEFLLFMDADGSHPASFIPVLWAARQDYDVIMASRYISGGGSSNSASSKAMSRLLNAVFGKVLGIDCRDLSNSFKLYRRAQLQGLNLTCANFDIIPEILLKLHRSQPRLRTLELPFQFERRVHGESKRQYAWFILAYLWTLLRLRCSND